LSIIRLADGESVEFLRVFSIGLYKGGMSRLLLRADKTETHPTRIDVLFMNTKHLCLPTSFEGLRISDVTGSDEGDALLAESRVTVYRGTPIRVYRIASGSGDGHVIAGSASYIEDAGEYWEPSGFMMDP
jgi:hypothetical protein